MRLPWFQLAHQVLPVPVGRNQMLGYPRKDTPAAIPNATDVTWQVAGDAGPSSCWVGAF